MNPELDPRIDGTEVAMKAISNQFDTMCHEKWIADKRICALKAEIARRQKAEAGELVDQIVVLRKKMAGGR